MQAATNLAGNRQPARRPPFAAGLEALAQRPSIAAHCLGHAMFQRIGGQSMPDRHFAELRNAPSKGRKIGNRQVMTGVHPKPCGLGAIGRLPEDLDPTRGSVRIAIAAAIGSGVELDAIGTGLARNRQRLGIAIALGKQRNPHAARTPGRAARPRP